MTNEPVFYYIFKTNHLTGKTESICNGSHNTEVECKAHWTYYCYGIMDAYFELTQCAHSYSEGDTPLSMRIKNDDTDIEYFMLLGQEGRDLIFKLANI